MHKLPSVKITEIKIKKNSKNIIYFQKLKYFCKLTVYIIYNRYTILMVYPVKCITPYILFSTIPFLFQYTEGPE